MQRMVAQLGKIDAQRLRLGKLREDEWPRFTDAIGQLAELPIYVDDTPSISVLQLRTKCRRLASEVGVDMVFVDYLQLMTTEVHTNNRVQEVSYISRALKGLARELDAPLMAASQLSRAVEQRADKHPQLSDLRESGALEQDSDVVMFIYRDEMYNPETETPRIADVEIAKHRNGPTGMVQLFFNARLTKFADAARTADLNLRK